MSDLFVVDTLRAIDRELNRPWLEDLASRMEWVLTLDANRTKPHVSKAFWFALKGKVSQAEKAMALAEEAVE